MGRRTPFISNERVSPQLEPKYVDPEKFHVGPQTQNMKNTLLVKYGPGINVFKIPTDLKTSASYLLIWQLNSKKEVGSDLDTHFYQFLFLSTVAPSVLNDCTNVGVIHGNNEPFSRQSYYSRLHIFHDDNSINQLNCWKFSTTTSSP